MAADQCETPLYRHARHTNIERGIEKDRESEPNPNRAFSVAGSASLAISTASIAAILCPSRETTYRRDEHEMLALFLFL